MTKKISKDEAVRVAREIMAHVPEIIGIDIFGSIARQGKGNDIDMFIRVSDELCRKWLDTSHFFIRPRTLWTMLFYYAKKYILFFERIVSRKKWIDGRAAIQEIFGDDFEKIAEATLRRKIRIDTILIPEDWIVDTTVNNQRLRDVFCLSQGTVDFLIHNASSIVRVERENL